MAIAVGLALAAASQPARAQEQSSCRAASRSGITLALQGALDEAARLGELPEPHALYVSFKTTTPGVSLPAYLAAQYPDKMTIILQYQYQDLSPGTSRFEVTLSFNGRPERIAIPYAAVTYVSDPAAKLCLFYGAEAASQPIAAL